MTKSHRITELLQAWSKGDDQALEELIPLVDNELRRIAHAYMSNERIGHTLQTTALIHEALIRLIEGEKIDWRSRRHFYSLVALRMRRILIEHAREKLAAKRGKRAEHVDIEEAIGLTKEMSQDLLMLDAALTKLGEIDARKAKIVEARYFGGFTNDEIADILGVSAATVEREWRFARLWLRREMTSSSVFSE